jgi:hypothetical protein
MKKLLCILALLALPPAFAANTTPAVTSKPGPWKPIVGPIVANAPNPVAAEEAILSDASLSPAVLAELMPYKFLFEDYSQAPTAVQQAWQVLIQAYGNTWLTPQVQAVVEQHASANNIILVPAAVVQKSKLRFPFGFIPGFRK